MQVTTCKVLQRADQKSHTVALFKDLYRILTIQLTVNSYFSKLIQYFSAHDNYYNTGRFLSHAHRGKEYKIEEHENRDAESVCISSTTT